jgi:3-hydroxyacyl-CoA dehydrogenase
MSTIAFIGLGNMGGPMAANLIKAGHKVVGTDVSPAAVERHVAAGGTGAASIAEAVREGGRRRHHAAPRAAKSARSTAARRGIIASAQGRGPLDRFLHHRRRHRAGHGEGPPRSVASG